MDYATLDALGDKLMSGAILLIIVWLVVRKRKTPKE